MISVIFLVLVGEALSVPLSRSVRCGEEKNLCPRREPKAHSSLTRLPVCYLRCLKYEQQAYWQHAADWRCGKRNISLPVATETLPLIRAVCIYALLAVALSLQYAPQARYAVPVATAVGRS